jgi:predicted RNase H-like HicB family nuclease
MIRLRLKNPVAAQLRRHHPHPNLNPDFPLKTRIHAPTHRQFHIVSLPQKDGSYVASVVEAPSILVYDESRKVAEEKASKKFLRTPDPHSYRNHPLARTKLLTIDMEFDADTGSFVTYIKELHRMSTFGESEMDALDNTAEMIRGYIQSMEANHKKIPLTPTRLGALKRIVGLRQNGETPSREWFANYSRSQEHPRTVPVPVHGPKALPRGTLLSIIRMAGVTKEEFFRNAR